MTNKTYSIGSIKLDPKRVNKANVSKMRDAVKKSRVRKGKKAALAALDSWTPKNPLQEEQFEQIESFVSNVKQDFKTLERQWWVARKAPTQREVPIKKLEEKLSIDGQILLQNKKLVTEISEASAREAVLQVSGSLTGIPGIVAAYAAFANGPTLSSTALKRTEAVMEEMHALTNGESEMITKGNSAKQVHQEELWKAINNLLDKSIDKAEAGKPTELDLQYYELTDPVMVGKIADSAKAGNKIRLNLDAGRLAYPGKDSEGAPFFSLDRTPDKIRAIIQLATVKDADIGVSLYPQKKHLNSPIDLMHRKVMRVGNEVLISGMNLNKGSGENVDSGYIVRGKAAAKLAKNVARDIQDSKGSTLADIWGTAHIDKFNRSNIRMGKKGLLALLDIATGPTPAGKPRRSIETLEQLEALARKAQLEFSDLVVLNNGDSYEKSVDRMLNNRGQLQLSDAGKQLFSQSIERAIALTNTKKNLSKLDDMEKASSRKAGDVRVDIADTPTEREALVLNTIANASEFLYLPAFVVTRGVAAAIIKRRDQMQDQGKELDVRVIADSAMYPHGSNPNSWGVKLLEDHDVEVRWSRLNRSGSHDRKIHAKQMITENGEITGSTNFSNQGLRENWETSAFVHFNADDEKSVAAKENTVAQFEKLWDQAVELNTKEHSAYLNRELQVEDKEWFVEAGRERSVRHIIRLIGNYEREAGKFHKQIFADNPQLFDRKYQMVEEGYSKGNSALKTITEFLGEENHRVALDALKTNKTLGELQGRVLSYAEGVPEVLIDDEPHAFESPEELYF